MLVHGIGMVIGFLLSSAFNSFFLYFLRCTSMDSRLSFPPSACHPSAVLAKVIMKVDEMSKVLHAFCLGVCVVAMIVLMDGQPSATVYSSQKLLLYLQVQGDCHASAFLFWLCEVLALLDDEPAKI